MRLLDRYIANAIISGVAVTLFVLLGLFAFFAFVEELAEVGKGNYQIFHAVQFVMLSMVTLAYQLFPIAALLGCIMGLGALASNSELVAIRSAGVSVKRIAWSVFKVGGLMMCVVLVLGEGLAPLAEDYALKMRSEAISGDIRAHGDKGLWAKDGQQFIQIEDVLTLKHLGKVTIYETDNQNRIVQVTTARQASYYDNFWLLRDVQVRDFGSGVVLSESKEKKWRSKLTPEMLDVVRIDPDAQAIVGLYQYVDYLKDNGLASGRYEMAFWGKVVTPLVTIVMMMLALPFVFGALRSVSIGQRIVVGTLVGLGFHLFNQMSNYAGLVFEFNPFLSATLPAFCFTFLAVFLLRRIH